MVPCFVTTLGRLCACLTRPCGILGHVTERRDWLLTRPERGNPSTRVDDRHEGDHAWSEGNLVTPLVHGAAYFMTNAYRQIDDRSYEIVIKVDGATAATATAVVSSDGATMTVTTVETAGGKSTAVYRRR